MCFTLQRRPDIDRQQMQQMWEHEHATLVSQTAMGFTGYAQAHTIDIPNESPLRIGPADAMGFLTYPSLARLALRSSLPPALLSNIRLIRDEPRFVHPPATTLALGTWIN